MPSLFNAACQLAAMLCSASTGIARFAVLLSMALLGASASYAQQPFITTWKTNNTGTSNSTSITIPTTGTGYNYDVDWNNDGTYDETGITGNVTHNFGVAGTYTIRIRGTFPRIFFNNGGDRRKLLDVGQWGDIAWSSMGGAFHGCSNLNISATDLPNLGGVTDMSSMFSLCTILNGPANIGAWNTAAVTNMSLMFFSASAFNQPIGTWNTAAVTNMVIMFQNASAFNQPIGAWNTAAVTSMNSMFFSASAFNQPIGSWTLNAAVNLTNMLNNCGMDCNNYSATLIGWNSNPATPNGRSLGATGRQYGTNAVAARTNLTTTKSWTISGDAASGQNCDPNFPFITTWKTDNPGSSNSTSITIPTTGGGYNYDADWNNDGTYDQTGITGSVTHDFGVAGTYTIRIRGAFPRIFFNNSGDRQKLLDVGKWGDIAWTSMANAFHGCSNLNISATDLPNLAGVTDMSFMFSTCTILNGPANIGAWNTAAITNISSMFSFAGAFNQPIGSWNTAAVTNMSNMFQNAFTFNQPIGSWNTAAVTNMNSMFTNADDFNQPIGSWNTAAVTNMGDMFLSADPFNQPIGAWNTAAVTNMSRMFFNAGFFNQPIGTWNTAAVTNMGGMFTNSPFNQPIGSWNTAAVTNMSDMFAVTNAFNQPIGTWNTAAVTNMSQMFWFAGAFNQPIGSWTLNAAVNLTNMLNNCGMDCNNYSATLIGWNSNPATPNGRSLGAIGRQYGTNAAAARTNLTTTKGWTISGDALTSLVWYKDTDDDGYSDGTTQNECTQPPGYQSAANLTATSGDCNDNNNAIHPGATETCNGIDDDCDGLTDDEDSPVDGQSTWYSDTDGDGYGNASSPLSACVPPANYVPDNSDCDDTNGAVNPLANEACNGLDDDCDGNIPEEEADSDGDGDRICQNDCNDEDAAIHPGAEELCNNNLDDDCDGLVNEGCGAPLTVDAGSCEVVFYGYAPQACTTLTAVVSGGISPYTYSWSNGSTGVSISVCPDATTVYTVTVTDNIGATAVNGVTVEVVDVHCGNNNDKVLVCHDANGNSNTLCVAQSAVPAHLDHGDYLGTCGNTPCSGGQNLILPGGAGSFAEIAEQQELEMFPNPTSKEVTFHLHGYGDEAAELTLFDYSGKAVWQTTVEEGQHELTLDLSGSAFVSGVYFVKVSSSGNVLTKLLVISK